MFDDLKGPIEHFSWAKYIISGVEHADDGTSRQGKGKDIVLIGDKVRRWKTRKGHVLSVEMVEEVLGKGIKVLVIGSGVNGALAVPPDVIKYLHDNGIEKVFVEKTPEACRKYNELSRAGENAALLAHGTC